MLSTAAGCWGPGRDRAVEPHGAAGPLEMRFSPYAFNGGTVLAIAGEDFSIVASDTRLSEGYSIHTRDSPKCYRLTDKTVIGCSGFHGDCLTLTKIIEARLKMYKHSNNKTMTTGAIAAMLSTILYSRRFFPYYVYNIIGGLDEEGKRSDPGSSTEIRSASVTLSGATRWQCCLAQSKPPCHRSDLQRSRLLACALPVHRLC
ncbi:proteasome subunit beta type-1 isoform X2 [Prionailurus bengalensis]|uniref:proteasome subunit beta type-1 isoform X2 n=1 Tax=Prionailurus bengalensis TaxID=37029 RepID=UPI001CA9D353|nr:proteasome subunit beta type-1 isoform X2 [Prionailurus bengalensis]